MSGGQSPERGQLGTNTEGLRSYGREITGHSGTIEGLKLADLASGVVLPGSATAQALANAAEACGSALGRVHKDYEFGGDESVKDSRAFEEHEEDHAERIRAVGEQI